MKNTKQAWGSNCKFDFQETSTLNVFKNSTSEKIPPKKLPIYDVHECMLHESYNLATKWNLKFMSADTPSLTTILSPSFDWKHISPISFHYINLIGKLQTSYMQQWPQPLLCYQLLQSQNLCLKKRHQLFWFQLDSLFFQKWFLWTKNGKME